MRFLIERSRVSNGAANLKSELINTGHRCKSCGTRNITSNSLGFGSWEDLNVNTLLIRWGVNRTHGGANYVRFKNMGNFLVNGKTEWMSNKLMFFNTMNAVGLSDYCVPWTTDMATARSWLESGRMMVVRKILNGHSGNGIVLCKPEPPFELPEARLYTQYVKKKYEYRVHMFRGLPNHTIWQQKKALRNAENVNYQIRNHDNGWVFTRRDLIIPDIVRSRMEEFRTQFFERCSVDFAAVDVIYNDHTNRTYVLEANTAPGLEGQTVKDYTNAFVAMHTAVRNGEFALSSDLVLQ